MSDEKKNPDELGALWIKTGGRGDYMTGTINGVAVVCFANDRKAPGSKQPDWRVLKSKPRDAKPAERQHDGVDQVNDDSIPF